MDTDVMDRGETGDPFEFLTNDIDAVLEIKGDLVRAWTFWIQD